MTDIHADSKVSDERLARRISNIKTDLAKNLSESSRKTREEGLALLLELQSHRASPTYGEPVAPVRVGLADLCIAMARDLHELATGKRPTEAEAAKGAGYLYSCATKGALAWEMLSLANPPEAPTVEARKAYIEAVLGLFIADATTEKDLAINTGIARAANAIRDLPTVEADKQKVREGEHHKLDNDRQVFFYEQDFYVLSNFSSFNLKWSNRTFPTSEHAYHWSRFALNWDLTDAAGMDAAPIAELVRAAPSAHEAFKLAQQHRDLQHPDWNMHKIDVMRMILLRKAEQHEYVRRKLLATGDRELIEDSWRDDFWGWGPNRDGQNMLGKLWMEVRSELRSALSPTAGERG